MKNQKWVTDHVNPIWKAKSRANSYNNFVLSCWDCNLTKGMKTGVEYPQWIQERKQKYRKYSSKELLILYEKFKKAGG